MTLRFRNRQGKEISFEEVQRLMSFNDGEYMVVKQTYVGPYWISTVWCPFAQEDDRLFETAIFNNDIGSEELTRQTSATEGEARAAHIADVEGLNGLLLKGIDFTGIIDYIRGNRDELPPTFREVIDRVEPEE